MRGGPKLAAAMLPEVIPITAPPRHIEEWLTDLILQRQWAIGQSEAEELAERWADKVLDLVESNSAS